MVDTVRGLLGAIERTASDTDPSVDVAPVVEVIERLLAVAPRSAARDDGRRDGGTSSKGPAGVASTRRRPRTG
jgi:two-component system chemotaxis sensor kinase CheA